MISIERYRFEDGDGVGDSYTTYDVREAEERAAKYRLRVIADIYEWAESEVVYDYTESDEEEG